MTSVQALSFTETLAASVNRKAFTLIEFLVTGGIILLLGCVLLPSLAYQRRQSKQRTCVNNLKGTEVAFRTWARDQTDQPSTGVSINNGGTLELANTGEAFVHFRAMSNELSTPKILVCPCDGMKTSATAFNCGFSDSNVSYFVSPDARDVFPQMFQTGDRNLEFHGKPLGPGLFVMTTNDTMLAWTKSIHYTRGNVGLGDGSVQSFGSRKLALAAAGQDCVANRLAIP